MHDDQVRNHHEEVTQQDLIDVLDKQLFDGMGVSLTDDEQQRTQATVSIYFAIFAIFNILIILCFLNVELVLYKCC